MLPNREISIHKPLKAGKDFTLLDILVSKQDEFVGEDSEPKVKIPQARRSIEIDQDVTDAFRARYGNMPLGRAIRVMLGLKPKIAQNAWQAEEDAMIRIHYPTKGGRPLATIFGRSLPCVGQRAAKLGIRRTWLYKRDMRHKNPARREKARLKRQGKS